MTPQTFLFIGRSGAGKGTQSRLLQEYLKKVDPTRQCLYIQTGAEFREFIKGDSTTRKLSKEIYDKGEFQPEFLAIYMWTNVLVNKYTANEHLVFDGMARKLHEAGVLDSIFSFYKLGKPHVVYINLENGEAKKRLLARNRIDDVESEIDERLSWFDAEVAPIVEYFRNNPRYEFITVDGAQTPEKVHEEIISKAKI